MEIKLSLIMMVLGLALTAFVSVGLFTKYGPQPISKSLAFLLWITCVAIFVFSADAYFSISELMGW